MAIPKIISTITATVFGTAVTDDYLLGTSADDIISGGIETIAYVTDGVDTFQGGAGDDIYIVNDTTGSDVIIEFANEGVDTVFSSVDYTLPSEVENIVAADSAAGVVLTGNSVANILDGSQSADADTLQGMEGNDTYIIGTGDKIIEGKLATSTATQYTDTGGIDTISSAASVDISAPMAATGGQSKTGTDVIKGQAFIENVILTGETAASITGNAKDNRLTGNSAVNTLTGGAGNDNLDGGTNTAGGDTLVGGVGNDNYIVRNALDVITEGASAGTDTIISALAVDMSATALANIENITLIGTSGVAATGNALANTIKGNSVGNTLSGGTGTVADTLYGLQGNDTLDGGLGSDKMYGGRGDDTYKVDNTGDVVDETVAGGGTDLVESFVTYSLNTAAAAAVENLTLKGSAAINATGNSLANALTGNSNANILNGGTGADDLRGAGGNDTYVVDNASDKVTDSGGTDLVQSSVTFNLLTGNNSGGSTNVENITLTGTSAINATGNEKKNIMTGNSNANTMDGGAANDTLTGNGGNDTLTGGTGDDKITGGAGRDIVKTGDSTDTGGATEQDTIVFAAGVTDTVATTTSIAGVDLYSDLFLNADVNDLIDLTVVVANVDTSNGVTNTAIIAAVSEATFITDMNAALGVTAGVGFQTTAGDISAAVVSATGGLAGRDFLAVDLDKNGIFKATDFVIEITGSNFTALDVSSFV